MCDGNAALFLLPAHLGPGILVTLPSQTGRLIDGNHRAARAHSEGERSSSSSCYLSKNPGICCGGVWDGDRPVLVEVLGEINTSPRRLLLSQFQFFQRLSLLPHQRHFLQILYRYRIIGVYPLRTTD
jgi:hypothetical protein